MKKLLLPVAGVLGFVAFFALLPLFDASLPRGIRITREDARRLAEPAAHEVGIEPKKAWVATSWLPDLPLDSALRHDSTLRRQAEEDLVLGPRLGVYRVTYYDKTAPKYEPLGWVEVDRQGRVAGARKMARREDASSTPSADELRRQADAFIRSRQLPGAPNPVFESDRPTVLQSRTDHAFRYKVASAFPAGDIQFLVTVHFSGDKFSGWQLTQEHANGRELDFREDMFVGTALVSISTMLALLLVLLVLFLRKYHEGEVGVGVAGFLLGVMVVLAFGFELSTISERSIGTQIGAMSASSTALAWAAFELLFFYFPLAVLVFLGWSVGESYARERWGERLASFDSILRRDLFNATVGRSLLVGVVGAPIAAAAALAGWAIPVAAGLTRPAAEFAPSAFSYSGSPWVAIMSSLSTAIVVSVVSLLCILGGLRRRAPRPVAVLVAIALGTIAMQGPRLDSSLYATIFGFGAVAVAVAIFARWDLLAASVSLFGAGVMIDLFPIARIAEGTVRVQSVVALAAPLVAILVVALSGLLTRREVTYHYEDLAPHVRRIVERERVKAEIDAANRIQAALLPSTDPSLEGITVSSHYRAATEIGGDYFDFLDLENGRVGVAFGDVAGHGLTSGIVMAMAKAALLVQVQYDASPIRVMEVLNDNVMRTAPPRMMMTFFFGILDPASRQLRFSSAGHLDPYVWRASTGKLECLSAWGFPLGVKRTDGFREMTVLFETGDRMVLYSDGLIEAIDDQGEPFGFDRFERVLEGAASKSSEEIKKAVLLSVKKFTNNRPPEDDQTLVVFSFDEEREAVRRSA